KLGLLVTGTVYTVRGLFLAPQIGVLTRFPGLMNGRQLLFSLAALVVGLIYLVGTRLSWKYLAPRANPPWIPPRSVPSQRAGRLLQVLGFPGDVRFQEPRGLAFVSFS